MESKKKISATVAERLKEYKIFYPDATTTTVMQTPNPSPTRKVLN